MASDLSVQEVWGIIEQALIWVGSLGVLVTIFTKTRSFIDTTQKEKPYQSNNSVRFARYLTSFRQRIGEKEKARNKVSDLNILTDRLVAHTELHGLKKVELLLHDFLKQSSGVLLGSAGAGKSTGAALALYKLTAASSAYLPIWFDEEILKSETIFDQQDNGPSQILVTYVKRQITEAGGPAEHYPALDNWPQICLWLRSYQLKLVIVIDAYDELLSLFGNDDRLLDVVRFLKKKLAGTANFLITSRLHYKQELIRLNLPFIELVPFTNKQIKRVIKDRHKRIQPYSNQVLELINKNAHNRPLYIWITCKLFDGYISQEIIDKKSNIDFGDSGVIFIHEDVVAHAELKYRQGGLKHELPFLIMSEVALGVASDRIKLTGSAITELIKPYLTTNYNLEQLQHYICSFLTEIKHQDTVYYTFFHEDYIDYWLVRGLLHRLVEDVKGSKKYLILLSQRERMGSFCAELLTLRREEFCSGVEFEQILRNLATSIEDKSWAPPNTRKNSSVSAAALGLRFSINPSNNDGQYPELRGRCLQKLRAIGKDLSGYDLATTVLRESDLRGANLEEVNLRSADLDSALLDGVNLRKANLQGANLRNSQMGGINNKPTDLSEANLTDSQWFNFRASLRGYFQFWMARFVLVDDIEDSLCIWVSSSRGTIVQLVVGCTDSHPKQLYLPIWDQGESYAKDILDFDLFDGMLATVGRDCYLRIYVLAKSKVLRLMCELGPQTFSKYPRRVKFSSDGKWLAVADSASLVYILQIDSKVGLVLEHIKDVNNKYMFSVPPYGSRVAEHTGELVCLDAYNEFFYTGGYDGRILKHRMQEHQILTEEVSDLAQKDDNRLFHTIRALCVGENGILWVGSEDGCIYSFDAEGSLQEASAAIKYESGSDKIFAIAVNRKCSLIVVGFQYGLIDIYKIVGRKVIKPRRKQLDTCCGDIIRAICFSSCDRYIMACSWSGVIKVWDCLADFNEIYTFNAYEAGKNGWEHARWHPSEDHNTLRLKHAIGIDTIKGLSSSLRRYLVALAKSSEAEL